MCAHITQCTVLHTDTLILTCIGRSATWGFSFAFVVCSFGSSCRSTFSHCCCLAFYWLWCVFISRITSLFFCRISMENCLAETSERERERERDHCEEGSGMESEFANQPLNEKLISSICPQQNISSIRSYPSHKQNTRVVVIYCTFQNVYSSHLTTFYTLRHTHT